MSSGFLCALNWNLTGQARRLKNYSISQHHSLIATSFAISRLLCVLPRLLTYGDLTFDENCESSGDFQLRWQPMILHSYFTATSLGYLPLGRSKIQYLRSSPSYCEYPKWHSLGLHCDLRRFVNYFCSFWGVSAYSTIIANFTGLWRYFIDSKRVDQRCQNLD